MIETFVVRPLRRNAEPKIPMQRFRHRVRFRRPLFQVQPVHVAGLPRMHFLHFADGPVVNQLHSHSIGVMRLALIPHLRHDIVPLAASRIIRASCTECVNGFWQKTCLPSAIAASAIGACMWSGVETLTASNVCALSSSRR